MESIMIYCRTGIGRIVEFGLSNGKNERINRIKYINK